MVASVRGRYLLRNKNNNVCGGKREREGNHCHKRTERRHLSGREAGIRWRILRGKYEQNVKNEKICIFMEPNGVFNCLIYRGFIIKATLMGTALPAGSLTY